MLSLLLGAASANHDTTVVIPVKKTYKWRLPWYSYAEYAKTAGRSLACKSRRKRTKVKETEKVDWEYEESTGKVSQYFNIDEAVDCSCWKTVQNKDDSWSSIMIRCQAVSDEEKKKMT